MFHRSSADSFDPNAGIAVPVTPTEILRKIIAGVTSRITESLASAGGLGLSATADGPSPNPRGPWHVEHCAW
jgi:hypothetical protein